MKREEQQKLLPSMAGSFGSLLVTEKRIFFYFFYFLVFFFIIFVGRLLAWLSPLRRVRTITYSTMTRANSANHVAVSSAKSSSIAKEN